jgi:hypothetical protein
MRLRRYRILLAALVILPAGAIPASADEILFSPPDTTVFKNDIFPVQVMIDDVDSLMGYNISVSITGDPCLKIMGLIEGLLPGSNGDETFFRWLNPWSADSISVNGSILGATVDGPGILFTIMFKALEPGTAWLDFSYSDLRDGTNAKIIHDPGVQARIVVAEPVALEESSWGAIKAIYR